MPVCIHNGNIIEEKECALDVMNRIHVYEVIRIIEGKALFLDDHLQRLSASFALVFPTNDLDSTKLKLEVLRFLQLNQLGMGNFRIDVSVDEHVEYKIYPVFYDYPSEALYQSGVSLVPQYDERMQPSAKQYHQEIKQRTKQLLEESGAYETLLINAGGKVTEGSRSNVFWIKEGVLFSAPHENILHGITRKHLLRLCQQLDIPVVHQEIPFAALSQYEAAFLCGTSPMVLPIRGVENLRFQVDHDLLRKLMREFKAYVYRTLE